MPTLISTVQGTVSRQHSLLRQLSVMLLSSITQANINGRFLPCWHSQLL